MNRTAMIKWQIHTQRANTKVAYMTVEEGNQRKKIMWKEAMWARN